LSLIVGSDDKHLMSKLLTADMPACALQNSRSYPQGAAADWRWVFTSLIRLILNESARRPVLAVSTVLTMDCLMPDLSA
jgi:hypothetical protein